MKIVTLSKIKDLTELLQYRADLHCNKTAFTFLKDGENSEQSISFYNLERYARSIGFLLSEIINPYSRVLLLLPSGLEYIASFFGTLYAGGIAVTSYPPQLNSSNDNIRGIIRDSKPSCIITTENIIFQQGKFQSIIPELRNIPMVSVENLDFGSGDCFTGKEVISDSPAFLQYTSGSTCTPKGVIVTHKNTLYNEKLLKMAFDNSEESIGFGWLPLYHDMGLIGTVLQSVYCGMTFIFMSPFDFLRRPVRWLKGITKYRATASGGPNFAYDICNRVIKEKQMESLDLSSWRIAVNGSEPIRSETIKKFSEKFKVCGFEDSAFYPCYGLAEATLLVTGSEAHKGAVIRKFDDASFFQKEILPARKGQPKITELVSSGFSRLDQEVLVVDPEKKISFGEKQVGEIWVKSPGVASGYWDNILETSNTFCGFLAGTEFGPYLRTGDLGFFYDNELFVTGRLKDLIIIRGKNLYPHDIELQVRQSHSCLEGRTGAAFTIPCDTEEKLVVIQEISNFYKGVNLESVYKIVRKNIVEVFGVDLYLFVLVKTGGIPKTTSGKIQRGLCKQRFLDDKFQPIRRWEAIESKVVSLLCYDNIYDCIIGLIACKAGVKAADIDMSLSLRSYGIDSLKGMELLYNIKSHTGVSIPSEYLLNAESIKDFLFKVTWKYSKYSKSWISKAEPVSCKYAAQCIPLFPVQKWFLRTIKTVNHWNASYMFFSALGYVDEKIDEALKIVIERHEALRICFKEIQGELMQVVDNSVEDSYRLTCYDFREQPECEELIHQKMKNLQGELNIYEGPLVVVGLFKTDDGDHLYIVVHHIIIDAFSFKILLEDLYMAYVQLIDDREVTLQVKSESFFNVGKQLYDYARSDLIIDEIKFWKKRVKTEVKPLPRDYVIPEKDKIEKNIISQSEEVLVFSDIKRLKRIFFCHNIDLFTVALTAWGYTVRQWVGDPLVYINISNNGRNWELGNLDISRTVGPFWTTYPLVLDMDYQSEILNQMEYVNIQNSQLLYGGRGYDVLRELVLKENRAELDPYLGYTDVFFNYLGEVHDLNIAGDMSHQLSSFFKDFNRNDNAAWTQTLTINLRIVYSSLVLQVMYNKFEYKKETIRRVIERFRDNIGRIIRYLDKLEE